MAVSLTEMGWPETGSQNRGGLEEKIHICAWWSESQAVECRVGRILFAYGLVLIRC